MSWRFSSARGELWDGPSSPCEQRTGWILARTAARHGVGTHVAAAAVRSVLVHRDAGRRLREDALHVLTAAPNDLPHQLLRAVNHLASSNERYLSNEDRLKGR